jgi:SAM-dependent methyltransferase
MSLDVVDLRGFYGTPLGRMAERFVGEEIVRRWESLRDCVALGLGYAAPYLDRIEALSPDRRIAFMPASQGVIRWPQDRLQAAALVDWHALPLRDQSVERVLLVHALEMTPDPAGLLQEVWRILSPGGRMICVVPNRGGVWARIDNNPFAQGQPYSKRQLTALMRTALFTPVHWSEALYAPPSNRNFMLRFAPLLERFGRPLSLPLAGVHVIEATKQLYRPVLARKALRIAPEFQPVLAGPLGRGGR